jgi:hypothetical protein
MFINMSINRYSLYFSVLVCLLAITLPCFPQTAQSGAPNADPTYLQLRNVGLAGEALSVKNVDLKRDAATFRLHSGTICFVSPVQGVVTGAAFAGDGDMLLDPLQPSERASLKLLTKGDDFREHFERLVLRFTDSTYDEIKKSAIPASVGCDAGLLQDSQRVMKKTLHYNLSARILQDILRGEPSGLFVAFVHGKNYDEKILFQIDPHGAFGVGADEVELRTYDENKLGTWTSFPISSEYRGRLGPGATRNSGIHIEHQQLDTTIEKSAFLSGKATTTFLTDDLKLRVVPFNLHRTLRVQSVTTQNAQPLSFIQEGKDEDPDFYVILPKALAAGEKYQITTTYSGKDAITNEGKGNYYPVARSDWYPNNSEGDQSQYDLTFRIPKGMKMAATGSLVSETVEAGQSVTVWKSDTLQQMAGFQFGRMKEEDAKVTSPDMLIAAYANEEPPDWTQQFRDDPRFGTLSTATAMKQPLSEAQASITLYTDFFGPLAIKRLNITQQTACNYGQSWPGLIWLPVCSFYDTGVRHWLGLDFSDNIYWKVVTPHEVAHQWWAHTVHFNSYRDNWMSEGFSDFSASLVLQNAYGARGQKEFIGFWDAERKSIVEKNVQGFRPIDVGPLTMGYRLNNSRTGNIARDLIYPKGAFILHMIRMMMWDRQSGEQDFKRMMKDFVTTYSGKAASTEDFKAIVEKHMTDQMKGFGNGSMDWFFDEYVYGTALPTYRLDAASFNTDANGNVVMSLRLVQSGVDAKFQMLVPIYLELADGRIVRLGRAPMVGNTTFEQEIPIRGLKDKPRRALINFYDDVLCSLN